MVRVAALAAVGAVVETALDARGPVVIEAPNRFSHPGYGSFVEWDEQHTALTKGAAQ